MFIKLQILMVSLTYYGLCSPFLAIFCSFLVAFGDACFNTQVYSILGGIYPNDSAPAFALFKFVSVLKILLFQKFACKVSFSPLVDGISCKFLLQSLHRTSPAIDYHRNSSCLWNSLLLASRMAQRLQKSTFDRHARFYIF